MTFHEAPRAQFSGSFLSVPRAAARLLLAAAILSGTLPLKAEQAGMEESLFMDMPVMTPSKFLERASNTPAVVTVVDATEIRNMGARTLADVVNLVPGFEQNRGGNDGSYDVISVRGRVTTFGEDVLVLLDGQRMNNGVSGGSVYLSNATVDNVKRIEFIRGPGSTIYGSNAFTGIINVITQDKNAPDAVSASVAGGGLGDGVGTATLRRSFGKTGKVELFARREGDTGDSYKFKEANLRLPGEIPSEVKDPLKQADDAGINASWGGFFLQSSYAQRKERGYEPLGFLDKPFSSPILDTNHVYSNLFRVQTGYDWDISQDLSLISTFRYFQAKTRDLVFLASPTMVQAMAGLGAFPPGTSAETLGWFGGPNEDSQDMELEMQANYRLGAHQLVGGVVRQREALSFVANAFNVNPFATSSQADYGSTIHIFQGDGDYLDPRSRDVLGVYAQDTWKLAAPTALNFGARYDRYSDFGSAVSPRVALVHALTGEVKVKALYGRAYRAPTFSDLYIRNNPTFAGNKDVKAEKIDTFEVNTGYTPTWNTAFNMSVFHNVYRDLLEPVSVVSSPVPVMENATDKEQDWGGEIEGRWKKDEFKYVSASVSYVDPHDSHGDQRPDIARKKAGLSADYDVWPKKGIINVSSFYHGARKNANPSDPNHKINDAVVVNVNLRVLSLLPKTDLDVGFYNIGDTQWRSPGPIASSDPENFPNRGFQWLAKLTCTF